MKRLDIVITLAACAALSLVGADAFGQYYTPLRYDLRHTSPTYIPSGTMRFGPPARYDPYRFGNYNPGNLSITGNLRLGKSFQGTSPYRSTGSQLSMDLPSTRLSDFRRDTIGIEDVGTGLEYGQLGAFYPGSASVTTPYTAGMRFAVPTPGARAPYVPRNVNVPVLPQWSAHSQAFTSGYGMGSITPTIEEPMTAGGLAIPPSVLTHAAALLDGRISPMPEDVTAPFAPSEVEDLVKSPYERFGHKFESEPANIFIPDDAGEHAGDMTMPDDLSSIFWLDRETAGEQDVWAPQPGAEGIVTPWNAVQDSPGAEAAWPEETGEDETEPIVTPVLPPSMPVSTYAVYVMRGHAAMKEGDYGKAEALYAAGVALEPDRPAAFFGRIHALLGRRLYLQAIVVMERELAQHPQWVNVVPSLKGVYAKTDVYDRILEELQRELETKPNDVGHNLLIGYVYYSADEKRKARLHLEKAARARDAKPGPEKAILAAIEGG
ncbi:MAG TPA: hypothetical protein VM238_07785 [Phycisphaerae bacterium]|nr:hypothetical protein [Phycisphaerae bacterium]